MSVTMTRDEAMEYAEHLRSQGFQPQEIEQYFGENNINIEGLGPWSALKQGGALALDTTARGLDYLAGVTRTGAGELADAFIEGDKVTGEDWLRAREGKAPTTAELSERMGVDKLGSVNVPFVGEVTGRDVVGFGGDVLLDPLTYASFGASTVAKKGAQEAAEAAAKGIARSGADGMTTKALKAFDRYFNKPSDWVTSLGKKSYKSGLKRVDQEAAKYGKDPVSDLLIKNRIAGSAKGVQKGMDDLADTLKLERDAILAESTRKGGVTSMKEAMKPTQDYIAQIRASRDPQLQPLADALQADVDQYLKLDPRQAEAVLSTLPRGREISGGVQKITPKPMQMAKKAGEPNMFGTMPTSMIPDKPANWVEKTELPRGAKYDELGEFQKVTLPKKVEKKTLAGEFVGEETPVKFVPGKKVKVAGKSGEGLPVGGADYIPEEIVTPGFQEVTFTPAVKHSKVGPKKISKIERGPLTQEVKRGGFWATREPVPASYEVPGKWVQAGDVKGGTYKPKEVKYSVYEGITQPGELVQPGPMQLPAVRTGWTDEITPTKDWYDLEEYVRDQAIPQKPLTIFTETDPTRGPMGQLLDNSGVTPKQSTGFKTTIGNKIPDSQFQNYAFVDAANKGSKAMAGGLREATEKAVGRSLGDDAARALKQKNDDLGKILTTRDVQAREAAKEANKNYFTSVDGILVGVGNPKLIAAKKGADALKSSYVRTMGGRALMDLGTGKYLRSATPLLMQRSLIESQDEEVNPWLLMPGYQGE